MTEITQTSTNSVLPGLRATALFQCIPPPPFPSNLRADNLSTGEEDAAGFRAVLCCIRGFPSRPTSSLQKFDCAVPLVMGLNAHEHHTVCRHLLCARLRFMHAFGPCLPSGGALGPSRLRPSSHASSDLVLQTVATSSALLPVYVPSDRLCFFPAGDADEHSSSSSSRGVPVQGMPGPEGLQKAGGHRSG